MKIAVDATCWNNRRGFGRFTRELVAAMAVARGDRELALLVDAQTAASAEFPAGVEVYAMQVSEAPIEAASAKSSRSLIDLWRCRQAVVRLQPDVIFFPAVYSFFPVPSYIPTLVTIHDVIAETHPDQIFASTTARWLWNQKVQAALRSSNKIATVSQNARLRIAKAFGRNSDEIAVIGEGVERFQYQDISKQAAAREQFGIEADEPILLYVGGISPHKNLAALIRSLRLLADRGATDWRLVLAGEVDRDSFYSAHKKVRSAIRDCGLEERAVLTGYVEDQTLASLYSAARMLVLPSLDEGFGLPAAEAMACGTPVAASNAGALPEVVGGAGVLFDPLDENAMAAAIEQLLNDDELHASCSRIGVERAKQHRWSRVADKVFAELERIAGVR